MLVIFCLLFKLKDAFHFPGELFIGLKMGKIGLGWQGGYIKESLEENMGVVRWEGSVFCMIGCHLIT